MRWSRRTFAASSLLGSTLVYAMPSPSVDSRSWKRFLDERAPLDGDISMVTGFASPSPSTPTSAQNQNQSNNGGNAGVTNSADSAPASTTPPAVAAVQSNPSPTQAHDTLTDTSTNPFNDISMTSGFTTLSDASGETVSALAHQSTTSSSSTTAQHSSLAHAPTQPSSTNHGVLIGIVVGGLVLGCVVLTIGLWLCYRRRGPTSGASTPKYNTAVIGDEKPSFFAFLRGNRGRKWKKGHLRVKSSQSFASPMIANDPKLMEEVARTRTRTLSMKNSPALPPHLTGTSGTSAGTGASITIAGRDRWSTFSSSDGGSLQTPIGPTRLDGIIMETVVESDAHSNSHSPTFGGHQRQSQHQHQQQQQQQQYQNHQSQIDYLDLKRTPTDDRSPFDSQPQLPPLALTMGTGARMSKLSLYRDETDPSSPSTPTSSSGSGSLTYGSNGRPRRTSDRYTFTQPLLTTNTVTPNVSYPTISTQHQASSAPPPMPGSFFSGANANAIANALVNTRPKFNPTHTNKSGVSVGANSGNSGNSGDTIKITNPFLGGDEDDLSSYGHGLIEADHLDLLGKGEEDALSLNSTDSGVLAYASSTGCLPKPSPSPNQFANPLHSVNPALIEAEAAKIAAGAGAIPRASTSSTQTPSYSYTHPRSSMISDSSSDYPYPLGYAIDHEGNVANPFLRISEILEEVDGRMRWPSPPLLPRSESRNY